MKGLNEMGLQEILLRDNEFKYMLLCRLQHDAIAYASNGGRLWAIFPEEHAKYMVEIYKNLPKKPKWLSLGELKTLYFQLTDEELVL